MKAPISMSLGHRNRKAMVNRQMTRILSDIWAFGFVIKTKEAKSDWANPIYSKESLIMRTWKKFKGVCCGLKLKVLAK